MSPAFRWAQSLNTTFIEVKFATRFDSPACLDVSNLDVQLDDDRKQVSIAGLCGRNDAANLLYKLDLDLSDTIKPFYVEDEEQEQYILDMQEYEKNMKDFDETLA